MKTLYLHIGTPKTGTTAIQYFCVKNRDTLEKNGLYYPDFGYRFSNSHVNRNGAFYITNLYDENKKRKLEEEKRIRQEGLEKLRRDFETHDAILLSDEGYWNHAKMEEDGWKELLEICKGLSVQLKVIVYLRRQDELIQSYWAQKVKERNLQLSLSQYIENNKYTQFHLDYYERLQIIARVVGKENMIVRAYEKRQYQGKAGNLLSDFFNIFNLDISEGYEDPDAQKNPSLHGEYLETKRLLNANKDYAKKGHFIIKRLIHLQRLDEDIAEKSKEKHFSYDEALEFLKQYEESNQKTAREFLGREDGILFYESLNPEQYVKSELTTEDIKKAVQICGKIIMTQEQELLEAKERIQELKEKNKMLKASKSSGWKDSVKKLTKKKEN